MQKKLLTIAALASFGVSVPAVQAQTLDAVRERGFVQCGVTEGVSGFSIPDEGGNWVGIEVDYCRAVAAAIFDNPDAVRYTPLNSTARWEFLSNGSIDILSRQTTWTMQRDTELGITFVGTVFYDGQGFMVREDLGVTSVNELSGATICIEQGTTTELNAADYFAANGLDFVPLTFVGQDETVMTYEDGGCDAYTTDSSVLAAERSTFADPDAHIILPEIISKEPLGPSVRAGDLQWFNIARWVYYALLNAEELGVTQANVDEMLGSENPSIRRLLGVEGDFGSFVGLSNDWAYRAIKGVGNYGEMYEAHLGENTPIGIPRGINSLWNDGGIQYAPPIR
jgi:general L-amino acid transport system substrate-binding protein